jgi:hypothetical protein
MATYALTIEGASKRMQEGFVIRELINGRNTINFGFASLDGSYRPALRDEVVLTEDAVRIFGGNIDQPTERSAAGHGSALLTNVSAVDFNALADRRVVNGTLLAGTLKEKLEELEPFLTPYSVALDAGQVTGPSVPELTSTFMKISAILDRYSTLSGYVWEIDYNKELRMFSPASTVAPFDVVYGDGTARNITVEPSTNDYANSVWIIGGGSSPYIAQQDDGGSLADLVEAVVQYPDITDTAVLDDLAVQVLAQFMELPRTIRYTTRETGIKPGMIQNVTIPAHGLSAVTCLITEIETRAITTSVVERTVTMVEGTVNGSSWRDVYKQWAGGSGPSSGVVVFGGGDTLSSPVYLGGSRNTTILRSPAGWAPVVDYVPYYAAASFAGQVRAQAWARNSGVSATVRLYNVTDSIVTATSSPVTSTTATDVTPFLAGISAGKTYRLEVQASADNQGVYAIGSLEHA